MEDGDMNFDDNPAFANMPPLDKMRKIRRDVLRTINEYREAVQTPGVYHDILANKAATEYAEYLLENEEDPAVVTEILNKHLIIGSVTVAVGYSYLEEDDVDDRVLHHEFMDAHGLLLELEEELEKLTDPKVTHIGVGFAWSKQVVKVVEFLSVKPLMINQLTESEEGGVDVRGMMLSSEVGLYAARIVAVKNLKKDIKVVGPPNIQFDKNTRTFIINVEGPVDNIFYSDDVKVLEIYIRKQQIDKIQYRLVTTIH
jgi:hypothetical protein